MRTSALLLLLGAVALPLRAQSVEGRVEGQVYTPGAFERLEVSGLANVKLTQSERDEVFIAGNADVQKGVDVSLRGGRLLIRPNGGWKFWTSTRLQIEVQVRQLEQLVISGASDLHAPGPFKAERLAITISGAGMTRFDELAAEQLRFSVSGAGEGQLRGQTQALSLSISGKGRLQAEQLRTAVAAVSISGVGNASLWVTDTLRVSVSGIGTVDYWGQPQTSRSVSGMATVNAHGDRAKGSPAP